MITKLQKMKVIAPRDIAAEEYVKLKSKLLPNNGIDYICAEGTENDSLFFIICTAMFFQNNNSYDFDVQLKKSTEIELYLDNGVKLIHYEHTVEIIHEKSNSTALLELKFAGENEFAYWSNLIAGRINMMKKELSFFPNILKKFGAFFKTKIGE